MKFPWYVACLIIALSAPRMDAAESFSRNLSWCKWHESAGAELAVHGDELEFRAKSLAHPAPRTITCWVTLPGSGPLVVRGTDVHFQEVDTYNGWTFTFERADGERRVLNDSSQEWNFTFPVPAGWSHDKRLGMIIGIPGNNPTVMRLKDLRLEVASEALPRAPQAVSPTEDQEVSSPAADFLWSNPDPGFVIGYDLLWQRTGEESQSVRIPAFFTSDAQGYWPHQWLRQGYYSWKVRALNAEGKPGPWSKTMRFTVIPATTRRAPDLVPGTEHPIFIVNTGEMQAAWKQIPPDVRSHVILRIGGSLHADRKALAEADRAGIPVALQVNGPHDIIIDHWDRIPLARLEAWAHRYPELKAFYICEQAVQGGVGNADVRNYLERLIALGAEVGRPVFWADADWGRNTWLEAEANLGFRRYLDAHQRYIYPIWKMNGGLEPYLAPAGLLGLWLSHTVAGWGVQPESWYWTEAGFTTLGVQRRYKEGVWQDGPPVLFQDLALLGVSAGAKVYSFEGPELTSSSYPFLKTVLPPLVRMLTFPVIPSLSEVGAATHQARVLEPSDLIYGEHYSPSMHRLLARTLGTAYPYEMVPESGACYWPVFLPPRSSGESGKPGGANGEAMPPRTCAPPVPGDAAVFRIGNKDFIFNSRLNWAGEQGFSIHLAGTRATGKLGLDGWITTVERSDAQARLWFNARPGAALTMAFRDPVIWKAEAITSSAARATWSKPTYFIDLRAGTLPWNLLIRRAPHTTQSPFINRDKNHSTNRGAIPEQKQ